MIENVKMNWLKGLMALSVFFFLGSCNNDNDLGSGEVAFEITDAPLDDSNVKGVFVTVAEIKVDGKAIEGFSKQTIDLKAYQKGETKLLGNTDMAARTYNNLTLVLDTDADSNGAAPGCYVLSNDNVKYKLTNSAASNGKLELNLTKSWSVANAAKTNVVMDFDLRKALKYAEGSGTGFNFVSNNNLQAAVRVVTKSETGTIKGTYQNQSGSNADKVIAYLYKKGTFNAQTETTAQGEDKILFANAVSSALVESGLSSSAYTLAFLEAGEYELYFAGYKKETGSNRYAFESRLESEMRVNGTVSNVFTVNAGAEVNISASILGVIN